MALSRAFTKKEPTKEDKPSRSFFSSKPPPSIRNKISSPLALISTTNQLAYNAPDLFPNGGSANSATSTPASATSKSFAPLTLSTNIGSGTPFSESDEVPELLHSNSSTPDSSTRGSTPTSTEPNHLSGYFAAAVQEKRKSDEAPVRSMSRAGKVGELLNRKRSESRVGRSPAGSVSYKAAQKPSLQSIDSTPSVPPQFAPAPFNSTPKSPLKDKFEPTGFAPVGFNNGPKNGGSLIAPSGGGLMRKNTVRARGSIDMFSPGMGVENKPSISNLRDRRQGEDNKPKALEETLNVTKPSNSIRDRQISNQSSPQNQNNMRSPLAPKGSASHADLRSAADGRHPALRAKASLNIRPSTANEKVIPPARSFTHSEQSGRIAPSPMGMRKASPIDEAMATLDEVAKDMGVDRQVKREVRKEERQNRSSPVSPEQRTRTTVTLRTRIVDGEKSFMAENAHTFTALDYMSEIQDLSEFLFPELKVRREAVERSRTRGMAGVVQAAQMQQYNMI